MKHIEIKNTSSAIVIDTPIDESGVAWYRFLKYNNIPVFKFGPTCETCQFYIEKCSALGSKELSSILNSNEITSNNFNELVEQASFLFPTGNYVVNTRKVILKEIDANEVASGSKGKFYLNKKIDITEQLNLNSAFENNLQQVVLYDLFIPLHNTHDVARIKHYKDRLTKNEQPAALVYSMMEVHGRDHWFDIYLLNFIVDGHHKAKASSLIGKPINTVSFYHLQKLFDVLPFMKKNNLSATEEDVIKSYNEICFFL